MKQLRPYQDAAIKGLFNWLYSAGTGNPLVVAPVGSGKSLMIAEFIRQVHADYPRTRIVVLSHVKELLVQNAEELRGQYADCDFGFYCASLGEKRTHNDITFASIQSIAKKLAVLNRCPEIIIVDECHLISHNDATMYRKFFDAVKEINPNVKIIGFTGTPFRSDSGRLDEGDGALFDGVAYEIPMSYMIEQGYWAKPVTPDVTVKMDVSGIGTRQGDYIIGQLEERINTAEINDACVRELIRHGASRKKWLVFTAAVKHCEDVCAAIRSAGIACAMVTGETDQTGRDEIIASFRRGDIKCLVNVAVLTTGFNVPDVDLLAFMRPTKSPVLYIQTTGRGIRPIYADGFDLGTKEGRLAAIAAGPKPDCMILDFGGVIDHLGPIDAVDIRKKHRNKTDDDELVKTLPQTKICPHCAEVCMAGQRYCYRCSYCFIELDNKPAQNAVVSMDEPPQVFEVLSWSMRINQKEGKLPTLLVTYNCETERVFDAVRFDHPKGTFPHDKARHWHKTFASVAPMPQSVEDGLKLKDVVYQCPCRITARRDGKFWRITDYDFSYPAGKKKEKIDLPKALEDEIISW